MSHLRIDETTYPIARATLVAYHCDADEADWNLELQLADTTLWLSGTCTPPPATPADLADTELRVDLRALDELVGALLGRPATLYPVGDEVLLRTTRAAHGVHLATTAACDWDHDLETFPHDHPIALTLAIDATITGLHPGPLP